MGKVFLFSPIGNTDPIKYFNDGSMLHICRVYKPDIVYLYLSQEMLNYHYSDNRYVRTLELLGKRLEHKFDIRIIARKDLVEVQQYDYFYHDFKENIALIRKEMVKGDRLLLNMASGTPAMKSALLVLSTLAEYQFLPIQVSSPKKGSNLEHEERKEYDILANWKLNEDNNENFLNRCEEVKCMNLIRLLKIDMTKKHILAYDYHAAWEIGKELSESIAPEATALLKIAAERIKLNHAEVSGLVSKYKFPIYPVQDGGKRKLFEYALGLQVKFQREEYADFIRGITPLNVDLFKRILKQHGRIDIDNYSSIRRGIRKWDKNKLNNTEVLAVLERSYGKENPFRCDVIYAGHINHLIQAYCSSNRILCDRVKEMTQIESVLRNMAAHDIVSVTDEWIVKKIGKPASEIMNLIQYLCIMAGLSNKEDWKSYDEMNQLITEWLG